MKTKKVRGAVHSDAKVITVVVREGIEVIPSFAGTKGVYVIAEKKSHEVYAVIEFRDDLVMQ